MRFQVPQFIEVEDKIFGPFTFRQFIYLAGGAGMSFVIYSLLPFFIAVFLIVPVAALSLGLAFYKVNNRPFIAILEAALQYALKNKLYIWKKEERKPEQKKEVESNTASDVFVPRLSESKLKDISWSLDVQDSIYADSDAKR